MISGIKIALGRRLWAVLIATVLVLGASAVVDRASAAAPTHTPVGKLTVLSQSGDGITVQGWALDPDTHKPIHVDLYLDRHGHRLIADGNRSDVARAYPGYGAKHGFSAHYAVPAGVHTLCAYAIDYGTGNVNPRIGCRTITVNYSPFGALGAPTQVPGGFTITGWTIDHDQPLPALAVKLNVDGALTAGTANLSRPDVAAKFPSAGAKHGFSFSVQAAEGSHRVCVIAINRGLGADTRIACRTVVLNFSPVGAITSVTQAPGGLRVQGWALDPDAPDTIAVSYYVDGTKAGIGTAKMPASVHAGHGFDATVSLGTGTIPPGSHTICVRAANVGTFGKNREVACRTLDLTFRPFGAFEKVTRAGAGHLRVTAWAIDPDTADPISIRVSIDGKVVGSPTAKGLRPDLALKRPVYGPAHGLSAMFSADEGEHTVCATAINVLNGTDDTKFGCRTMIAVHPKAPSAPQTVKAVGGYGSAKVTWSPPASDGGAPFTKYIVTAVPGGRSVTVNAATTAVTITGLAAKTHYRFRVVAHNLVGNSAPGTSLSISTASSPPPQTSPAPISTSRYIRNVHGASAADLAQMKREGAADASHNPTGHRYLVLLDIGGQDQAHKGVVLSATTRFVSYSALVLDLKAYVDGYASKQKSGAPATIAIGTNNDMDVSASSGATWARSVVAPVMTYAARHAGMTIAGANDFEPGFRGTYAQSKAWLTGYLGATHAKFVFNGSADGCAWTVTGRACNNGWTMAGLYNLSAGAAPTRIVNLPQIYNNTMAAQWKYISLTGVGFRKPKINFGGALTEWTACAQVGGCGSLTGRNAWIQMWHQLQSHPALRTGSLPYSTDLRIDR